MSCEQRVGTRLRYRRGPHYLGALGREGVAFAFGPLCDEKTDNPSNRYIARESQALRPRLTRTDTGSGGMVRGFFRIIWSFFCSVPRMGAPPLPTETRMHFCRPQSPCRSQGRRLRGHRQPKSGRNKNNFCGPATLGWVLGLRSRPRLGFTPLAGHIEIIRLEKTGIFRRFRAITDVSLKAASGIAARD